MLKQVKKKLSGSCNGRWGRFLRATRGAAAVEFAMVAAPFLFTMFAILEVAMIFFGSSALEGGVQDAARLIRTRQLQTAGQGVAEFRNRLCADAIGLISCGNNLNVDVRTYPQFANADLSPPVDAQGNPLPGQFNPGRPGNVVVVRVYYVWKIYIPALGALLGNVGSSNSRLLLSTAAFRNEPQ